METRARTRLSIFPLLAVCFCFGSSASPAATYYVSPVGSDDSGNGSQNAPFWTLQKAHGQAIGGDTIYLRGGTYALSAGIELTRSGSANDRRSVSIQPAPACRTRSLPRPRSLVTLRV